MSVCWQSNTVTATWSCVRYYCTWWGGAEACFHSVISTSDAGDWLPSGPGRFTLGREPRVSTEQEAGWSQSQSAGFQGQNIVSPLSLLDRA